MIQTIKETIKKYNMVEQGDTVICALSGGADSVCMTKQLCALKTELQIDIVAAHFMHGLRQEDAKSERDICAKLCEELQIPLVVGCGDTNAYAKENKLSIENAARVLRYNFLQDIAKGYNNSKIATAHNLNDNAETVILNLVRGTGIAGLCGIPFVRDNIIRPLMCVGREEIESFLRKFHYANDPTNQKDDYTRNHIRLNIMPEFLKINSDALGAICSAAELLREEHTQISLLVEDFVKAYAFRDNFEIIFDIDKLREQTDVFLGHIMMYAYKLIGGDSGKLCRVHIQSVIELIRTKLPPKKIVMPSYVTAQLKKKQIIIKKACGE